VGALYVTSKSPKLNLAEQMHGGGHERGFRSGTLNVSGIVGFGKACGISKNIITEESEKLTNFRNKILKNFVTNIEGCSLNGHPEKRLPNNLNVSFGFTDSQRILLSLKELAISTGSACSSETLEPSYVLRAIGKPDNLCKSSVRFGLGRFNTEEEIDFAIDITIGKLNNIRKELK